MMSEQSRGFTGLSLLLSVALVLLVAACMCIVPGPATESAAASPGAGWEDQTPVPGGEDLYEVDAVDGDTAWAVGIKGTIFHTEDGGGTWTQQDSGVTSRLTSVSAVDTDIAWVAGVEDLLKTTDGGETWIPQEAAVDTFKGTPLPLGITISGLSAVDADNMWVSVNYIYPGRTAPFGLWYEAAVWKTQDGGASWTRMLLVTVPPMINDVDAVEAQVVWTAAGSNFATPYPAMFITSNGGSTWAYRYLGLFDTYRMMGVSAQDSLNAWAVYADVASPAGGVKKTSNGGMTWLTQPAPEGIRPYAVSALDTDTLWVVGSPGAIYKTVDGGATWIVQDSGVTETLNDVCAVDGDTAWAVGNGGVILKTTDGGGGAPFIYAVDPTSGSTGEEVNVTGYNYGAVQDSSYVSFGGVQATTYTSWSDTEIVVEVPVGATGTVPVTVTTAEGTSNPVDFTAYGPLAVTSITPSEGMQNTFTMDITAGGTGFQPGATLRLEKDGSTVNAINVYLTGETQITGTIGLLGVESGSYDVVVTNPDASEARLEGGFTVTPGCGAGSGGALLMLGLTLGLLSLAGSSGMRRMRRRRRE